MAWRYQIERIRILIKRCLTMCVSTALVNRLVVTTALRTRLYVWASVASLSCVRPRRHLSWFDDNAIVLFRFTWNCLSILWLIKSTVPLRVQFSSALRTEPLPMRLSWSWHEYLRVGDLVGKRAHNSLWWSWNRLESCCPNRPVPVRNSAKAVAHLTCIYCVDALMLLWKRLDFLTKLLKVWEACCPIEVKKHGKLQTICNSTFFSAFKRQISFVSEQKVSGLARGASPEIAIGKHGWKQIWLRDHKGERFWCWLTLGRKTSRQRQSLDILKWLTAPVAAGLAGAGVDGQARIIGECVTPIGCYILMMSRSFDEQCLSFITPRPHSVIAPRVTHGIMPCLVTNSNVISRCVW